MLLEIKKLCASSRDEKEILNDLSLTIKEGEVHAIMGPNGTGKSTLSKVLLGSHDYLVTSGDICIDGQSILTLKTDERARLGLFLSYQNPVSIDGVSNSEFLRTAINEMREERIGIYPFMKEMEAGISDLKMNQDMMHRSINQDFSGGERKKNEILQMKLLKPKILILDELDSGLDVDSLKIVCQNINAYLKEYPKTSVLMITHYSRILEYIRPHYVHIMNHGSIVKTGDFSLALEIEKNGYTSTNGITEDGKRE